MKGVIRVICWFQTEDGSLYHWQSVHGNSKKADGKDIVAVWRKKELVSILRRSKKENQSAESNL